MLELDLIIIKNEAVLHSQNELVSRIIHEFLGIKILIAKAFE